ncbi:hypothetical protein KY329_01635 [Candidatus Woesearchaeota archaeon]|nr:hypothetical protein [Candidatus Woesearchaeota archaeon]
MKKEWRWWLICVLVLVGIALYIFWPRGYVMLPLADQGDPFFQVFRTLPCRDELPSDTRAVVRFYDENDVPMADKVYTITPVSIHKGMVDDYDILLKTGWYWVANAKVDWCKAVRQIKENDDYFLDAALNLNTLRLNTAKKCFLEMCSLT